MSAKKHGDHRLKPNSLRTLMQDSGSRASYVELKNAHHHLFASGTSLSKIRDSTLADRLYPSASHGLGIAGRSFAWKLFMAKDEPLQSTSAPNLSSMLRLLRASRKEYADLLLDKMKAPDGSYEKGLVLPGASDATKRTTTSRLSSNLDMNNPLSLHDENPWNQWFASVELRKTILQDVERTFPDIAYFRDPEVQAQLTNILFLYSVTHSTIGYRQGMHEILAPLYFAVSYDAIPDDDMHIEDTELRELCSMVWIAADAWALFEAVMRGVSQWYEWREPVAGSMPQSAVSPLASHVQLNVGQNGIQPYVAPIVKACIRIQSTLLSATDPQLWKHMQKSGIEPQIYGIRWLRLLFTREFGMPDAMKLWDGLFACDPSLELAQWVCVAMLIRIRNELIPADYTGQLTTLLRYPSPLAENISPGAPHHASLLLRQALALQMSPTPAAGVSLMIENRNLLNIPVEVPLPDPVEPRRGHMGRQQSASASASTSQAFGRPGAPQMGLPEMLARGLLEKGESLGINKTLMSAVSELRRNIPDLASSLVRPHNQSMTSFPLEDERPPEERPPWEPRTRFEIERDISQTVTRDKRLGESLGWIVDTLLQDEGTSSDKQRLQKQKQEALESLSYVRDVLMSNSTTLDEDRLIGEEESLKRKAKQAEERPPPRVTGVVSPPIPAPVADSQPKQSNAARFQSRSPSQPFSATSPFPATSPPASGAGRPPTFAPWNYTRSSFSSPTSPIPSATLPRVPPPTSTTLRRNAGAGNEGYEDPLGALR